MVDGYSESTPIVTSENRVHNPTISSDNHNQLRNSGYKRYRENDSYNALTKVPKKVMFEDQLDENMQYIEHEKRVSRSSLKENEGAVVQINVIENSTGKVVENFDIPINKNDERIPKENEDYSDYFKTSNEDSQKIIDSQNSDSNKIMDLRIKNLIQQVVLNIPNICPICSQFFDTYIEVLKHKAECHNDSNEDFQICPVCQEHFYSNSNLIEHLNVHVDIQSYVCSLCSNNFYTEANLR